MTPPRGAYGRQHGAEPRNDHPLEIELACNMRHAQSSRTTEGENGKAPRIDAAAHRNQANPDSLGGGTLMAGIAPTVQVADRNGLHIVARKGGNDRLE
jgi:hypothetical protein